MLHPDPLHGLDERQPAYPRIAAERIAVIPDADAMEQALARVVPLYRAMVETLVVSGIALRIAQIEDLETRRAALYTVPAALVARVQEHVRRLYQTKPWARRKGAH